MHHWAADTDRSWSGTVMGFSPLRAALIACSRFAGLWLDGSIIIGCSGHCRQSAKTALRTNFFRSAPLMSSYWQTLWLSAGGRGGFSFVLFLLGWTANVSVLPDMTAWRQYFSKNRWENKSSHLLPRWRKSLHTPDYKFSKIFLSFFRMRFFLLWTALW